MKPKFTNKNNQTNQGLNRVKNNPNDEYYTPYDVVEKELSHYKEDFADKVIYLNCDNPQFSNFFKYFYNNFKALKIKRLISTYLDQNSATRTDVIAINGELQVKQVGLQGNGSFYSPECIRILNYEADIVITNPPFSLLRKLLGILKHSGKKYIIMAPFTAINYKIIFNQFIREHLWLGMMDAAVKFICPDGSKKGVHIIWLQNFRRMKNKKYEFRYENLEDAPYLTLDNGLINFQSYRDIPKNYYGVFLAPITIMSYFDYDLFRILWISEYNPYQGQELFKRIACIRKCQQPPQDLHFQLGLFDDILKE